AQRYRRPPSCYSRLCMNTVRTKNNIQRYFGTNSVIYSKKDEQSVPTREISKETESQHSVKENTNQLKSLEASIGRLQKAPEDDPQREMNKSELLKQLRQHEEDSRAQKDGERPKISFTSIISDMKVARSATARVSPRPVHQIQFDEGTDDFVGQEKAADLRKSFRKNIFKGKRLNIFELKAVTEEAPETEAEPSLWDVEFSKQLAAVKEQHFQNGFEEVIQLTKEGKLWEFPTNNEAGFDDDGSEFHEHIFLDKYLEDFPKQGPIHHFMELMTCGLSKNPYLSVKQKVEHTEWFRNYFNEKQDILKESGIQFN
ncbi:hypothetical protein EI555_013603, partial [Monodon monoceros]